MGSRANDDLREYLRTWNNLEDTKRSFPRIKSSILATLVYCGEAARNQRERKKKNKQNPTLFKNQNL